MENLTDRGIEARREYYRNWRAKNKDKIRENNRRYWEKRARIEDESRKETSNATDKIDS